MVKKIPKLYIPFADYQYIGGPATFMRNFETYLHQAGFSCAQNPQQATVIFFPTATHPKLLQHVRSEGGYILQRLDGVYYPSQHGDEYASMNQPVEKIYREYADFVIFQSEYSRRQCFQMFGEKPDTDCCIIKNGVHKHLFYPTDAPPHSLPETIRFVTAGSYRKAAMIEPIVTALDSLKAHFHFELCVIGPLHNQEIAHFFERDYVHHVGPKNAVEVGEILRNSHIFLHSQLNDNCPNAVLEAISSGLPVVGFNSGAMSELCYFSQELLADVSDELFHRYEDFDPQKLAEKIMLTIQHYEQYQKVARSYSHLYAFEECGQQYLAIFQRYLTKRRKMIPYMTTQITRGLAKIRRIPASLKYRISKRIVVSPDSLIQRLFALDRKQFLTAILSAIRKKVSSMPADDSLKLLFELDNTLYDLQGQESVRYGKGLHTKHKHIKYHDFFIQRIKPGSNVLDVGCGNGALAHDIATHTDQVSVYGIDILPSNIEYARQHHTTTQTNFVCGDALSESDLPDREFDIIVLSNVLEHVEKRVDFLRELQKRYHPQKYLIRVPLYERDWRVPLKEELGLNYWLDSTHFIEYRQHEFFQEMNEAGLRIEYFQVNWGEIWAEIVSMNV